jgi:hypothetical protein
MPLFLASTILLQQAAVVKMGESGATTVYKYDISGTIYCSNHTPVDEGIPMTLEEEDFFMDDDLGYTQTGSKGHFEIHGEEDEGDEPELLLKIWGHRCISDNQGRQVWIGVRGRARSNGVWGGKIRKTNYGEKGFSLIPRLSGKHKSMR